MAAGTGLALKPAAACRWDLVSLGEVMLRLDPGEQRVASTRRFEVWEGGGEYNVARGLARCFGLRTAIVTALVDNPVGRLLEDLMRQGGVDLSQVRWAEFDGVGRAARNGLNFTERGFGVRGALGCYDRGHTAIAQLQPGAVDWDRIFGSECARWFHTGGIFCGLSATAPQVAREAIAAARRHGTIVSYDLNYRESLWRAQGGLERAQAVNRELLPLVDVLFGVDGLPEQPVQDGEGVQRALASVAREFPNLAVIATPLRSGRSASRTDWGAVCHAAGASWSAPVRRDVDVLDRVGSGDAFAAGFVASVLEGRDLQHAVDCGAACGALAMSTPGDQLLASRTEVDALLGASGAGITRR